MVLGVHQGASQVRINDLAAPPEPMGVLLFLEPLVALLIICNGIMIGFQTHPDFAAWDGRSVLKWRR